MKNLLGYCVSTIFKDVFCCFLFFSLRGHGQKSEKPFWSTCRDFYPIRGGAFFIGIKMRKKWSLDESLKNLRWRTKTLFPS